MDINYIYPKIIDKEDEEALIINKDIFQPKEPEIDQIIIQNKEKENEFSFNSDKFKKKSNKTKKLKRNKNVNNIKQRLNNDINFNNKISNDLNFDTNHQENKNNVINKDYNTLNKSINETILNNIYNKQE